MKSGAIFDMDGLMFDTERLYQETWREIAAEMGITLPIEFTKEISGTNGDLLNRIVIKYYNTDHPEQLFERCVKEVEQKLAREVPIKPGLFELLEYLKANGVKLAVASSSYQHVIETNLRTSKTESYFDAVVSGQKLERGKPFPDIFLYAAKQLNMDPNNCYVFEDSINGVLAGLAAGCETIMVPDYVEPNETILTSRAHICSTLLEAKKQIEEGLY